MKQFLFCMPEVCFDILPLTLLFFTLCVWSAVYMFLSAGVLECLSSEDKAVTALEKKIYKRFTSVWWQSYRVQSRVLSQPQNRRSKSDNSSRETVKLSPFRRRGVTTEFYDLYFNAGKKKCSISDELDSKLENNFFFCLKSSSSTAKHYLHINGSITWYLLYNTRFA